MATVVFNFANTEKTDPSSLRENLERRNIAYEEKKEGNMIIISIKATSPRTPARTGRRKKQSPPAQAI